MFAAYIHTPHMSILGKARRVRVRGEKEPVGVGMSIPGGVSFASDNRSLFVQS
jgi:hypothetical protein